MKVVFTEKIIIILVQGSANAELAYDLKEFFDSIKSPYKFDYIIELSEAKYMDSTFMGVLTGFAMKLGVKGKKIILNKVCPDIYNSLKLCCLDEVFSITDSFDFTAYKNRLHYFRSSKFSEEDMALHILEAHENLMKVSKKNALKFKKVVDFLKHDIDKLKK